MVLRMLQSPASPLCLPALRYFALGLLEMEAKLKHMSISACSLDPGP